MSQNIPLASNARERFLIEIAKAVPAERIDELHFVPPIRQGPIETGVAVIAVMPHEGTRHIVYSARYRWTRKGPDRGKWDSEIIAEADAPLLTVEAVVEGVRKRAPEAYETERVGGDVARAMIADAAQRWTTTP
jgi:hypothetical protein